MYEASFYLVFIGFDRLKTEKFITNSKYVCRLYIIGLEVRARAGLGLGLGQASQVDMRRQL